MPKNYSIIGGIRIYAFNSKIELVEYVLNKKAILIAINAEKILLGRDSLKSIINDNIGYPDGIGAVWALKRQGYRNAIKIPGVELWLEIIAHSFKKKSFYLVGAKQTVIERTIERLEKDYPGINILNYRNGFIDSIQEKNDLLEDIGKKKPDIVFVATGSPNQELLMNEMKKRYPALYMGLGGSFDVYVNDIKRAPDIFIKLNLEWFYRLVKEPKRIKRQMYYFKFIWMLLINKF